MRRIRKRQTQCQLWKMPWISRTHEVWQKSRVVSRQHPVKRSLRQVAPLSPQTARQGCGTSLASGLGVSALNRATRLEGTATGWRDFSRIRCDHQKLRTENQPPCVTTSQPLVTRAFLRFHLSSSPPCSTATSAHRIRGHAAFSPQIVLARGNNADPAASVEKMAAPGQRFARGQKPVRPPIGRLLVIA